MLTTREDKKRFLADILEDHIRLKELSLNAIMRNTKLPIEEQELLDLMQNRKELKKFRCLGTACVIYITDCTKKYISRELTLEERLTLDHSKLYVEITKEQYLSLLRKAKAWEHIQRLLNLDEELWTYEGENK